MGFSYLQKFGGGLLIVAWLIWGSNMIGNALIPIPEEPASTTVAATTPAPAPKAPQLEDVLPLLASANIDEGKKVFNKCKACHTAEKGAGAKVGPDLWNVVERPKASFDHFNYSDAMKSKGGKWTYEELNHFIFDPRKYVPGTKMTFAGLKDTQQRADVIAYLRTLNDSPPPLPEVKAAAPAAATQIASAAKPEAAQETPQQAAATQTASAPAQAPADDLKTLLANADVSEGAKIFHQCRVCHSYKKGEGAKIGPNLWDVVGRPKGSFDHFSYSDGMKNKGGKWTYEQLFHFLANPQKFVPGTKMTFTGVKKPAQRADVIAYLRTLNDSPPPLP